VVVRPRPRRTRLLVVVLVSISLAVITLDYRQGPEGPLAGLGRTSISLMAPAVTIELFDRLLGGQIAQREIPVFIANLTDAAERSDDTCKPYGHSLLYLVSRSFEQDEDTPLLGMERHLVPALATHRWALNVQQLRCPGGMWSGGSAATRATTHGGVDDDEAVRDAVAAFIRTK